VDGFSWPGWNAGIPDCCAQEAESPLFAARRKLYGSPQTASQVCGRDCCPVVLPGQNPSKHGFGQNASPLLAWEWNIYLKKIRRVHRLYGCRSAAPPRVRMTPNAMTALRRENGARFSAVFQTVSADGGSELAGVAAVVE